MDDQRPDGIGDTSGGPADHRFSRGYVAALGFEPVAPEHWPRRKLGRIIVRHDVRVASHKCKLPDASVLVIGLVCDVRDADRTAKSCVALLAEGLRLSEERFFSELSFMCGRYVVFYRRGDRERVVTDATGMRMAMYALGTRVIASHTGLIGANVPEPAVRTRAYQWGAPGNRTPVEGIRVLTPNTKLDLGSWRVSRYWPRRALEMMEVDAAARLVVEAMRNTFRHLASHHQPLISITAGIDSRVTLAVSRGAARYMTYYRNDDADSDLLDRTFAIEIANRFGLRHDLLLTASHGSVPEDYKAMLAENTTLPHIPRVSFAYYQTYSKGNYTHIRSNLAEIARQFYQFRLHTMQTVHSKTTFDTVDDLMFLWFQDNPPPVAREAFAEFVETTDFFGCRDFIDLADLFYWEHRMGVWHPQVVLESDPAFETVSLYNCRHILETMLSVPLRDRRRATLLKRIILSEWPELAAYPVNARPFASYPFSQ